MADEAPRPKRRRGVAGVVGRVVVGLALGLAAAEGAFWLRDDGAFPHLNVYEPDPDLALRLRPGASQKIVFGRNNPVTSVRINAQGLRGADLPAPAGGEIIVVGDSQVFGLGVEESETASARLAELTGKTVVNAGVPTYGPLEYNEVARRLLERYRPGAVVYVVNFVNDLFEASHPNATRHAEWDGWAVRKETAPAEITRFPGRTWLFRDSHAVLAVRSYLYAHGEKVDDRGFASEGTAAELAGASRQEHQRVEAQNRANADERAKALAALLAEEDLSESQLEEAAITAMELENFSMAKAYRQSRNNPGDIVIKEVGSSEEGRAESANVVFNGANLRREMEKRIRAMVEKKTARLARQGEKLAQSLEERDALKKRIEALKAAPLELVRAWSPMTPHLRAIKAICDAKGAKLVVVALPIDVQVSESEWAKYGGKKPSVDMEETKILLEDLVASSEALGALGLDATPALAAAEPGAFLDADIHMTPKGQRALAEAIAKKLE